MCVRAYGYVYISLCVLWCGCALLNSSVNVGADVVMCECVCERVTVLCSAAGFTHTCVRVCVSMFVSNECAEQTAENMIKASSNRGVN